MKTIERKVKVNAPLGVVYDQWTRFEEFPLFMEDVYEVQQLDGSRIRWLVGFAGAEREWESQILRQEPDWKIAWSGFIHDDGGGEVTFSPEGLSKTVVRVKVYFEPRGWVERMGAALGLVSRRMGGDLWCFKAFVRDNSAALRTSFLGRFVT
jgi:uncharacterized membrane protein